MKAVFRFALHFLLYVACAASAQQLTASQAKVPSPPLADCPRLVDHPVEAGWCFLNQLSPVLQSFQILILGAVGLFGLGVPIWRKKRKSQAFSGKRLRKFVTKVDEKRLTALCVNSGNFYSAGFSGSVHKIDLRGKVVRSYDTGLGIIRSLCPMHASESILIGGDEGVLHVLFPNTGDLKRLHGLSSPVYRLVHAGESRYLAALGNGEVVLIDVQVSPAQKHCSFRELQRSRTRNGSVFDVIQLDTREDVVSVGMEGAVVWTNFRIDAVVKVPISSHTLWAIVESKNKQFVVASNDGSLCVLGADKQLIRSRLIHQGAARNLALSPQRNWCISLGKDRSAFAVSPDLSNATLVHRANDYMYEGAFDSSGQILGICDGSGEITIVDFGATIDSLEYADLRVALQ